MTKTTLHFFSYDSINNPWLGGGGSLRDIEMLKRYSQMCYSINLYVGAYPGCSNQTIDGITIHHLGSQKNPSNEWISRIHYTIEANRLLKKDLKGLVGANVTPYSPFWNIFRQKHVFGILHHHVGSKWKEKIPVFGRVIHYLEYAYYKRFKHLIVINTAVEKLITTLNPKVRLFKSANACDSSLFNLEDKSTIDDPFILFFGRMDRFMKGLDILINSFAAAYKVTSSHRLVLAGRFDQKQKETITPLIAEHVDCPISIIANPSNEDRAQLLSQCSFFCSPSRFEGWGIAALEACAAGKPVIVSKAEGFIDSISPDAGDHVDIDNPEALTQTLIKWITNPEHVELKKENARLWASNFTWDSIAKKEWKWLTEIFPSLTEN